MSIRRNLLFVCLCALCASNARADELLDDSPPIPPATAAALAEPAKPTVSAPAPAPAPATIAPVTTAQGAAPFAPAPVPVAPVAPVADNTDNTPAATPAPPATTPEPLRVQPSAAAPAQTSLTVTPTPDQRRLHLAAIAGVGATFDHTPGGVNPLGFGFGVRGDYRLLDELALGARVLYFVGGAGDLPTGKLDMTSWLIAAEASYVVDLDPVLVQPGLVLGVATRDIGGRPAFTNTTGQSFVPGSQNQTLTGLYLAPGVGVIVPLSIISQDLAAFFLGADTRLDLLFIDGLSSNVQVLVQGGLRL